MADHESAVEIFRHVIEFDAALIDLCRLLPEALALVDSRSFANRTQKLVAKRLARLHCPRLVGFVFEKMAGIQLSDFRQTRSRVRIAAATFAQFPFEVPHIHPEVTAIETDFPPGHDDGVGLAEQLAEAVQAALEGVITGVTIRIRPQCSRQRDGAYFGAPECDKGLKQ